MNYNHNGSADRRNKSRFALRREMRYKLLDGANVIGSGSGSTLDISSKGAAFTAEEHLKPGTAIEISVAWPALLDGNCAIRLVAYGHVVRSTARTAACSIRKFEFRTQAPAGASLQRLSLIHI